MTDLWVKRFFPKKNQIKIFCCFVVAGNVKKTITLETKKKISFSIQLKMEKIEGNNRIKIETIKIIKDNRIKIVYKKNLLKWKKIFWLKSK